MPKKWIVATAALAVVKGKKKKLTSKKRRDALVSKSDKQSSSENSLVSSGCSSSSRKEHSHSESTSTDSYSGQSCDELKATDCSDGDKQSDESDSTDSSSSYGCGTYHRRESLSRSSSSCYSDVASLSSHSDNSDKIIESPTRRVLPESEEKKDAEPPSKCKSHIDEELSNNNCNSESLLELGVGSRPSLKTLVRVVSSKKIAKKDADVDLDEESDASSKVSRKSNKSSVNAQQPNSVSLTPSMYDDEQASLMQRRPNMRGGRGRGRSSKGHGGSESAREMKSEGLAAERGPIQPPLVLVDKNKVNANQIVEEKFSDLLQRVRIQKLGNDEDLSRGEQKRKDAEDKFDALLKRVRSRNLVEQSEVLRSDLSGKSTDSHNKRSQAGSDTNSEAETFHLNENSAATDSRDVGGELSYSLKTELLANANSNLRSSVTSVASEESADSQNDDASKKSVGSSRFASMMANLKSTSEANINVEPKQSNNYNDIESDDEHIFEAPKIVNERGQSMRSLSSNEVSLADVSPHEFIGDKKIEEDEEEEEDGKRSRFRIRRPSLRQLICGPSDKSLEISPNMQKNVEEKLVPDERLEDYHSDDNSRNSDVSISTASSSEDQNASSVTNLARMRYPEDGENLSDDDLDYYGDPAMTILTPITEMGSIESDVETTSHVSDSNESVSDDGHISFNPLSADAQLSFVQKSDHNRSGNDVFQIIKRIRANDPALQQIELDGTGLNNLGAAKLLYLLHGNSFVTHVSLANNRLGDGSAVSLAQVLTGNETIAFVCLRGNRIGNKGALALKKVLEVNESLTYLDINGNNIDPCLLESLRKNSTSVPFDPFPSYNQVEYNTCVSEDPACLERIQLSENGRTLFSRMMNKPLSHDTENKSNTHLRKMRLSGGADYDMLLGAHSNESGDGCAICSARSFSIPSKGKDEETVDSCSLIKIYDKGRVASDQGIQTTFQDIISSTQKSDTNAQGVTTLMLAMSLALSELDSEWLLKTSPGSAEGRNPATRHTLGERKPWHHN